MESKYWEMNDLKNGYVNLYCPIISEDRINGNMATFRKVVRELKTLEGLLKESDFTGWVVWTELVNAHIMKMLSKFGCVPYSIDVKKETIWFKKEF